MMGDKIRIVLADDHVFVRDGIKFLLESENYLEVIGEAADGLEAIKVVNDLKPDMLILDIRMPHLNGVEVVSLLRKKQNFIKIIILSMHESEEYVLQTLQAGADGYLLKGASKEEFLKALKEVSEGGKYYSGDISNILVNQLTQISTPIEEKSLQHEKTDLVLTKREKEILRLVLSGKGNKDIAEVLNISRRTAEVHRYNLMKKLKVKNLIELATIANKFL
mgnify:CR=1 FL=1